MTSISNHKWSFQQSTFLTWCVEATGSCVLEAVAGAGKTTTLLEAAIRMTGSVAILAYNKKIAVEIQDKLKSKGVDWKKAQAGTVHSYGNSAYRKAFPHAELDNDKVSNIIKEMIVDHDSLIYYTNGLAQLVSMAKQQALGVVKSAEDAKNWMDIIEHFDIFSRDDEDDTRPVPYRELIVLARKVFDRSNRMTNVIDFDDMVFLPVFHRVRFWQHDVIMVDEAQDTNPARRALVRAMLKKGGRVIAVGDKHQAIYGFTGADSDALDLIRKDFNAVSLPLTTTYRCPKAVVQFAKQWVNHIEAADSAPEGKVSSMQEAEFLKKEFVKLPTDAILCRNTKPLIEMAFDLIRQRVACKVEGRDIGAGLKKLATRWKRVKTLNALEAKLKDFFAREQTKLLAKNQEMVLQVVEDQVDTLKVIIDQCRSEGKHDVSDLVAYIDSLFGDDVKGVLTLSTGHKSKGREWKRVFWLDRANTCPSRWARKDWQMEQENNLQYVIATRAMDELIEITV